MKPAIKGGVVGFVVLFVGLWIFMLLAGHDPGGWKCTQISGPAFCTFMQFISAPIHWAFVLFFSWVGFFAGAIDVILIKKSIKEVKGKEPRIYLKITSIIILTLIIVIGIIGILAFDNWVKTMIYLLIFSVFAMLVSWYIGKRKFG